MWDEQRQQKILKEKLENADKELEGCTFKPQVIVTSAFHDKINKYYFLILTQNSKKPKKDPGDLLNQLNDDLDTTCLIPGADKHFERIEKAARNKREKENILNQNQGILGAINFEEN